MHLQTGTLLLNYRFTITQFAGISLIIRVRITVKTHDNVIVVN